MSIYDGIYWKKFLTATPNWKKSLNTLLDNKLDGMVVNASIEKQSEELVDLVGKVDFKIWVQKQ